MEYVNKVKDAWVANWKVNSGVIAIGAALGVVFGGVLGWALLAAAGTVVFEAVGEMAVTDDEDEL